MLSGGHVPSPNERHPPDGMVHWTTGTDLVLKIPSPVVPASGLGPAGGGGYKAHCTLTGLRRLLQIDRCILRFVSDVTA